MFKLSELAQINNGKCNAQDAKDNGVFPLYDRSTEVKKSDKYLFDCEAIIVPGEGANFIPRYYHGKFNLHQRCYCIHSFRNVNGKYLFYNILANKDYFKSVAVGSTVPSLRLNHFLDMPLTIHSYDQQLHIVDTIGSIDDLIEHKLLLLDKLEQLEKNLYLKECLNKDKFSLLDRLQFIKGKKPKNFTDNGIDYLTIDALENGNLTYTNDEKLVYCKTNDILMVMDGASSGKVYIGYNGVVGSTLAKIKTNINPYYLYIYLKNNYKNIREHNIGSAIPHTNKDIIYTLKISNNTISNEIYNFLLNTRINLNIEIIHLKSLKTSYLKKFFG